MRKDKSTGDDDMEEKEMRAIPGYDGYLITRDGKLYSLRRKRFLNGEICLPCKKNALTYKQYLLRKKGKSVNVRAHRLVYITYKGPIPEKLIVHHRDGNGLNNSISNLLVMSRSEHSRKIMIRWYLCLIYPSVHVDRKNGVSISDIATKFELNDEIVETLLEKKLDEVLNDFNV